MTRRTLRNNVLVQLGAVGLQLLLQVATVPLLLTALGAEKYAAWLVLTAIPNYLSSSDAGVLASSSVTMSHLIARGERAQAAQLRRQVIMFLNWIAVAVLGSLLIAVSLPSVRGWLAGHAGAAAIGFAVFLTQAFYVVLSQRMSLTEGTFRANGQYAKGLSLFLMFRALEFVLLAAYIAVRQFQVGLLELSVTYLLLKSLTAAAYGLSARRQFPAFYAVPSSVNVPFAPVIRLGISSAVTPLGQSLFAQVSLIVAGAILGPSAVITLNTVRILLGFMRQVGNVAAFAAQPLMTVARARSEESTVRRLGRFASAVSLIAAGMCGLGIALLGSRTLYIWTRGTVEMPTLLIFMFVAVAYIEVYVLVEIAKLMATQQHSGLSYSYAASMAVACLALPASLGTFGIQGVPLASGTALVCVVTVWAVQRRKVTGL